MSADNIKAKTVNSSDVLIEYIPKLKRFLMAVFRYALLIGIGFIIIYPFLSKISSMFMSLNDIRDPIVWFLPRHPTLYNINVVIDPKYGNYFEALRNTSLISLLSAVLQTASCTVVGYGLARYKFRGRSIVYALMIFTIVIPPQTIMTALYAKFRFFDILGIGSLIGLQPLNLVGKVTPMVILSLTGLGLKNGLYILVLTQCFRSIPKELSEAGYVDGAGQVRTFISIMLPQAGSIMISVFLLSFSWQWTDTYYSSLFFSTVPVLPNIISKVSNVDSLNMGPNVSATVTNAAVIMLIIPIFLVYIIGQRFLIQGVERSGMVG